jgi:hypothetical protein
VLLAVTGVCVEVTTGFCFTLNSQARAKGRGWGGKEGVDCLSGKRLGVHFISGLTSCVLELNAPKAKKGPTVFSGLVSFILFCFIQ